MFSLSKSFSISCVHSRKLFPLSIFDQRETPNGGWLHLDNHLEKLLEDIFSIKISIPSYEERYRESCSACRVRP